MNLLQETSILLQKELVLEWRNKYAISGILLYVGATVFIIFSASGGAISAPSWNTFFWIVVLFASVNALLKSFVMENSDQELYYYSLANPIAIILSKILYNTGLLFVISLLTWLGLSFITLNPVEDTGLFIGILGLASLGLSITFTFIAAIASKASNSATLLAILGFPLVIPILLTLLKLSANALGLLKDTGIQSDIAILAGINLLLLALCFLLFPYLWRD